MIDLADLPGGEVVQSGLADLAAGRESVASYLVKIASRRLRSCGIPVEVAGEEALEADHRLYDLLVREHGDEAYGRYNSLLRELVSFERALEGRHSRLLAST